MVNLIGALSYFFVFSTKSYNWKNKYDGYDQRFGNETVEFNKINLIFKQYKLLNSLQSNYISEIQKTNLAKEYLNYNMIKPFNIEAGGLFKDFDFTF